MQGMATESGGTVGGAPRLFAQAQEDEVRVSILAAMDDARADARKAKFSVGRISLVLAVPLLAALVWAGMQFQDRADASAVQAQDAAPEVTMPAPVRSEVIAAQEPASEVQPAQIYREHVYGEPLAANTGKSVAAPGGVEPSATAGTETSESSSMQLALNQTGVPAAVAHGVGSANGARNAPPNAASPPGRATGTTRAASAPKRLRKSASSKAKSGDSDVLLIESLIKMDNREAARRAQAE